MKNTRISGVARQRMRALGGVISVCLCVAFLYTGLAILSEQGGIRLDLTPDALGTLSEGTRLTLDALEEDVHLYMVFQKATDTPLRQTLETMTQSYARAGRVTVDTIDPVAEPGRMSAFTQSGRSIAEGSVIAANADESRYEVVPAREMYTYAMNASGTYTRTGISAEQKITSAIRAVTGAESARVWFLSGHEEAGSAACSVLAGRLEAENYTVGDLTLFQGTELEAGDVLFILSPAKDLTQEEYAYLTAFLDGGGRMLYACDATIELHTMPLFERLATRYSLSFEPGIVVEDERKADYWMNSPLYLMPRMESQSISMQEQQRVILPGARAIAGPEIPLSGYTYETVLHTSESAYIKQTDSEAFTREAGDPTGTQQLAVSVSHEIEGTDAEMRAVFLGSLYTAVDNSLLSSTYNIELTMALTGFLAQREDAISVPVRSVTDTTMSIPSAAVAWRILGVTLCLPVLTLAAAVVVLIRRRRR